MPIYMVVVERRQEQVVYVLAPDRKTAETEAAELVDPAEWETQEEDTWAQSEVGSEGLPEYTAYWSGGEDGRWIDPHSAVSS